MEGGTPGMVPLNCFWAFLGGLGRGEGALVRYLSKPKGRFKEGIFEKCREVPRGWFGGASQDIQDVCDLMCIST